MKITTFRSSCTCLPPQNIIYRHYKNCNAQNILNDLETNLRFNVNEQEQASCVSFDKLTKIVKKNH